VSIGNGKLLVADTANHTIRMITADGRVTTVGGMAGSVGSSDGAMSAARFSAPVGLAVDRAGNIYVADTGNHIIRKGTPAYLPQFGAQPSGQLLITGTILELKSSTVVNGLPVTLQWYKDGVAIPGQTLASFSVTNAQPSDAGNYTVIATNALGSVTSQSALVSVGALPTITRPPITQGMLGGEAFSLNVSATGQAPLAYQWLKDGVPIVGATKATLDIPSADAADAGAYSVSVSNALGVVTTSPVLVSVNTARIVNLSIRTSLRTDAPLLTVGFAVRGSDKPVLVRAVGPGLRQFDLLNVLSDSRLSLFAGGIPIVSNDDWATSANASVLATTAANVGAFSLPTGSKDAALLTSLNAGSYSTEVTGSPPNDIVLVELYDGSPRTASRLINVSARAMVGTGDDILVAGFVVTGNSKKALLIRAVGPTLGVFGVAGTLSDPKLEVFANGRSAAIGSNDDWGGSTQLSAVFASRGAFPFAAVDSKDAALVLTLEPGAYSAQVSGVGGTTGEALIEIYEID
jgi:hypothetical protein